VDNDYSSKSDKIIQLNENAVKNHLGQIVRSTVEQTLNEMLDAEAVAVDVATQENMGS